jgi:hypothetical protein
VNDHQSLTPYPRGVGMAENVFINVKNRSHAITAVVDVPKGGANGVIVAQGGRFGGRSLYLKEGKPNFVYNWLGLERYMIAAEGRLPDGKITLRYEFAYDGGKRGGGARGRSLSTAGRSARDESRRRSPTSSPWTKPRTSASLTRRRSLRTTRNATTNSPAESTR